MCLWEVFRYCYRLCRIFCPACAAVVCHLRRSDLPPCISFTILITIVIFHHHPHDKLKHSPQSPVFERAGASLENCPKKNSILHVLYLHVYTYIQNGLDGSATANSFFLSFFLNLLSSRLAFVVTCARRAVWAPGGSNDCNFLMRQWSRILRVRLH